MANERDLAHDIADEGLEKIIEGDEEKGRRMIEEAKKRDPKAVEELAEEVERDREQAEHFIDRK
ncbi:MAG TPA: hypothetical protein VL985_02540 [Stellaceae bacterium]|nr:hypothetical protein [Stellaceae bacterium]